jgi:hypothetical protein
MRIDSEPNNRIPISHVVESKQLFANGILALFTNECPKEVISELNKVTELMSLAWLNSIVSDDDVTTERRSIYNGQLKLPHDKTPIFIKKKPRINGDRSGPNVKFFTSSIVHELRTAQLLNQIISCNVDKLRFEVYLDGKPYKAIFKPSIAWGGLIDTTNSDRYTFFKRECGESVRYDVASAGGWNNLSKEKRDLLSVIHNNLVKLAEVCLNSGLEPWDLGVHQLLLKVNQTENAIDIVVLDTEEYNIPDKYGHTWPTDWSKMGLPPVILFL